MRLHWRQTVEPSRKFCCTHSAAFETATITLLRGSSGKNVTTGQHGWYASEGCLNGKKGRNFTAPRMDVMMDNASEPRILPFPSNPANRSLLVTSVYQRSTLVQNFGAEAYSYRIVYQAFADLLSRWGQVLEIEQPATALQPTVDAIRSAGQSPLHLSFLPLHLMPFTGESADVSVLAWEYPDIPDEDLDGEQHNWVKMAKRTAGIITHTNFSRDAFLRARVSTPVHVVPVPIRAACFELGERDARRVIRLECPCYVLHHPQPIPRSSAPSGVVSKRWRHLIREGGRQVYRATLKRCLPRSVHTTMAAAFETMREMKRQLHLSQSDVLIAPRPFVDLSGVVYTSIFNPFDGRKNWVDLLTGFLIALADRADATLVLKLVISKTRAEAALREILTVYRKMRISHQCKVVVTTAYLTNQQMDDLALASTYYLNTSHCEGSCLPLQDYMASARPAIAPNHTGMADSLVEGTGFPLSSTPEPTCWPQDPEFRCRTTWQRLDWGSLVEQLRRSYDVACTQDGEYHAMARRAREHLRQLCSAQEVWPVLSRVLDQIYKTVPQVPLRPAA
jgi:glycosyltransferase involved in cell wall biosynthesis